jgi:low affinity Fe/Cu permease
MTNQKRKTHKGGGWLNQQFSQMAQVVASWTGHPMTFLLAVLVVIAWIVTGPLFNYSDTWQLVINTGTTIVTFLMVFLIQNTQNRDILTVQLKLSELVLAMKGAEDRFAAIEDLTDEELQELHEECKDRAAQTLNHLEERDWRQQAARRGRAREVTAQKRRRALDIAGHVRDFATSAGRFRRVGPRRGERCSADGSKPQAWWRSSPPAARLSPAENPRVSPASPLIMTRIIMAAPPPACLTIRTSSPPLTVPCLSARA